MEVLPDMINQQDASVHVVAKLFSAGNSRITKQQTRQDGCSVMAATTENPTFRQIDIVIPMCALTTATINA